MTGGKLSTKSCGLPKLSALNRSRFLKLSALNRSRFLLRRALNRSRLYITTCIFPVVKTPVVAEQRTVDNAATYSTPQLTPRPPLHEGEKQPGLAKAKRGGHA